MIWGTMIVWYLFLVGASAGAFAAVAIADLRKVELGRTRLVCRIMAVVAIAVGLVMLMLDAEAGLHNPGRFFLLFANPASMMSLGVYFITVYLVIALVCIVLDFAKKATPKWLDVLGILSALSVAAYTGLLLGMATPYPLWNNAALPVLFVVSGASAGLAAVLCAVRAMDKDVLAKMTLAPKAELALPVLEAFVPVCMLVVVAADGGAGAASVAALTCGKYTTLFWLLLVCAGIVVPFVLALVEARKQEPAGALDYVANACTLVGGFFLRYLVVFAAVMTAVL